jgi:PAS domain S-box-containing protein
MGVVFPKIIRLDPEEASLLAEIAGDIAFALNGIDTETERRQAESDLRESEKRFRTLFEGAAEGILVTDMESRAFKYANPAICRMLNYSMEELLQLMVGDILPKDVAREVEAAFEEHTRCELKPAHCLPCLRRDGTRIFVDIRSARTDIDGHPCLLSFFSDVTEQKRLETEKMVLERQLQQAQKMEALGQLAGGVAHDYNNMIGVILGYGELVQNQLAVDDPLQENIREIVNAAMRSKDITQQLLAFARQQRANPRALYLNEALDGMLKMLGRILGESVQLVWQPGRNLWSVRMDPSQFVQILTNLCCNARDAIADVGKVTICLENRVLEASCRDWGAEVVPGEYVLLSVSDDGSGMDRQTVKKIFDPFFTTKDIGRGTGLGLSTVYGVVKQNKGFISVDSEMGRGTTFRILFPRIPEKVDENAEKDPAKLSKSNGETILVVEDETQYLELIENLLTQLGYDVITAVAPGEALRLAGSHRGGVDLLITDVVMPEMNGKELWERLKDTCTDLKVIYISGYAPDAVADRGVGYESESFLKKPFFITDLAAKVGTLLAEA